MTTTKKQLETLGDVPSEYQMTLKDAFWAIISLLVTALIMAATGNLGNPEDVFRTPGF